MKTIKSKGEFTKGEIFNLTQGSDIDKVSDHVGEILNIKGWILYEDENIKGEIQTVLVFMEHDGTIMATISKTFIEQFEKMSEFMGDDDYKVQIVGGTSKNGREYISCKVAE